MSSNPIDIKVAKLVNETDDTVSIYLERNEMNESLLAYQSGQYITIELEIKGETHRRSYSMSSAPTDPYFRVSVKEVPGGLVSPFLCKNLSAGDTLRILPPEGKFVCDLDADAKRTYFLIGAGSGITPLMSIIRDVLESEPKSKIALLYGSRNETNIIFEQELADLSEQYEGQLHVTHTISQPTRIKKKGFSGILGAKQSLWIGSKGRIEREKIHLMLDEHADYSKSQIFYLCGPGKMIDNAVLHIKARGFDTDVIHREYFNAEGQAAANAEGGYVEEATIEFTLDKETHQSQFQTGKYLLESLIAAGYEPPYSCTSGACSTCIAKLVEGKVHMDICLALDDDEINDGFILTCQSRALTDNVKVNFDV